MQGGQAPPSEEAMKENLTTEQIIAEIERLKQSPYVKLAKKTENQALRQKLYHLRSLEKKGKKISMVLNEEAK